jgi:hypothetical protein
LQALARLGPTALATLVDRRFELSRHLELMDETVVEAVWRALSRRRDRPEIILISAPPRHGKSTITSLYLPGWFLGTFPDRRVILASYEADFAATWGQKTRQLLEDHGPSLYGVRVDEASRASSRWDLHRKAGGMVTAGVGGPITGRGAHLLVSTTRSRTPSRPPRRRSAKNNGSGGSPPPAPGSSPGRSWSSS